MAGGGGCTRRPRGAPRHRRRSLAGRHAPDASDEGPMRTARAVARESRGSPFLVEELVRSNRGATSATGATLAVLTLDQMIAERLERLPDVARKLVEVLAVGG